jgi:hypothetical protein
MHCTIEFKALHSMNEDSGTSGVQIEHIILLCSPASSESYSDGVCARRSTGSSSSSGSGLVLVRTLDVGLGRCLVLVRLACIPSSSRISTPPHLPLHLMLMLKPTLLVARPDCPSFRSPALPAPAMS